VNLALEQCCQPFEGWQHCIARQNTKTPPPETVSKPFPCACQVFSPDSLSFVR